MILDRNSISCLAALSNIYSLTHAYVDPVGMCVYASNGRVLFKSEIDQGYKDDEYPDTGQAGKDPEIPFLVHGSVLIESMKNTAKQRSRSLSILKTIKVTKEDEKVIVSSCSSLDCITTMTTISKDGLSFPDVVEFKKRTEKDQLQSHVCLSIECLEVLCKALKSNGSRTVKIELHGQNKPVSFISEDRYLSGLMMPVFDTEDHCE